MPPNFTYHCYFTIPGQGNPAQNGLLIRDLRTDKPKSVGEIRASILASGYKNPVTGGDLGPQNVFVKVIPPGLRDMIDQADGPINQDETFTLTWDDRKAFLEVFNPELFQEVT